MPGKIFGSTRSYGYSAFWRVAPDAVAAMLMGVAETEIFKRTQVEIYLSQAVRLNGL